MQQNIFSVVESNYKPLWCLQNYSEVKSWNPANSRLWSLLSQRAAEGLVGPSEENSAECCLKRVQRLISYSHRGLCFTPTYHGDLGNR